jgi:2-polyprenyl-6-methoxyphenol hydroxylase-like FAD-dependent oxidoreductase
MDTDVLVVGAGPVGLMMAAELRRHGVRCRILDVAAMSAYLVRPDDHVGYRAHPLRFDRLDAYLRRIIGERSS